MRLLHILGQNILNTTTALT